MKKGFTDIVIVIILSVVVTGVGLWYLGVFQSTSEQNTSPHQSEVSTTKTSLPKTNWLSVTNEQLRIRFAFPADASVSSVTQKQTSNETVINELIVRPSGIDPTSVHFFTTSATLDQAKNIQIYESISIKSSEFTNTTVGGYKAIRRIDHYLNNDCTNELVFISKNDLVYGYHIVQCPSHPQGYDQLRKDIANSLELL